MAVMGVERTDVLIAGRDFRIYTVIADIELQQMLIDEGAKFWELVQTDTPPEVITASDAARRWRNATAKKVLDADVTLLSTWQDLCAIRSQMDDLKVQEDELKAVLMEGMQDAVSLRSDGKTLAS